MTNNVHCNTAVARDTMQTPNNYPSVHPFDQSAHRCVFITNLIFSENGFNRAIVLRLLDAGVDINARTDWGDTAAHYAALHGTYEVLKLLCEEGISVDKSKDCKHSSFGLQLVFKKHVIIKLF